MTDKTVVDSSMPSLDDIIHCANCGARMAHTGQIYYCPTPSSDSGRNCPTNPVSTRLLLHTVFNGLLNRLVTDDKVLHLTKAIKATTEPHANAQRQKMERAEAALADANAQEPTVFQIAEHRTKYYRDTTTEVGALDQLTAARALESMAARDELDKINFISDEQGIRNAATNPATFLEGNSLDEAKEILDLLVEKVMVDSTSALIVYQVDMPTGSPSETVKEDRMELYPAFMS